MTSVSYSGNGVVLSATDKVNGTWSYTYDDFNRLGTSKCTATCPNATSSQGFSYTYDRYGNRWNQTVTAGSGPQPQLTFYGPSNVPNNRVDGQSYDAAGNLMSDVNHNYTYDAENRIIKVDGGSVGVYTYDAQGRRVARQTGSGSWEYLFDLQDQAITELVAGTTTTNRSEVYIGGRHLATENLGTTYFIHSDWLGTERARTNLSGALSESCQSLAFGDGQVCTQTDVSPLHFTGKQRDTETNLDNFDARYYLSQWARFVTPDWDAKPVAVPYAKFGDPQTLNLYSYVENAPLNRVDADGHGNDNALNTTKKPTQCFGGTDSSQGTGSCYTGDPPTPDMKAEENANKAAQNNNQQPSQAVTAPFPVIPELPAVGRALGAVADVVGDALGSALGVVLVVFTPTQTANEAQDTVQYKGGPKAADAPGVTAGGQATDAHGNKLGPSGETQIDRTRSNTREGARNRALGEGSGAVEHSNPRVGRPHWHPTDAQGNKKPSSTHHEYPED